MNRSLLGSSTHKHLGIYSMYTNILVPIALDLERDNEASLNVARVLANSDAKITLLHVMERIPGYAVTYLPPDYIQESRAEIERQLSNLVEGISGADVELIEGHSGRSILDWAERNHPDLIVIASHRPGMQDLLLGSTAAQVVRNARCAVHVLR